MEQIKPAPSVGWEERFMAEMVSDDNGWKTVKPSVKASIDFIRTAVREAELNLLDNLDVMFDDEEDRRIGTSAQATILELTTANMEEELDDCKSRIINTIAKLDNGSHSSSQLQAVDEYLTGVFNDAVRSARLAGFDEAVNVVKDYIGKRFIETDTSYAVFGRLKENLDKKRTELEGKA